MTFIKYCYKKHRIDITSTIRLGTFYGYRNHEKNEIRDDDEGFTDLILELSIDIEIQ